MTPFIFFLIFTLCVFLVARPFLIDELPYQTVEDGPSNIEQQKVNILKQIQEVEFEHEMGITSDDDYQRVRADLFQEASDLVDNSKHHLQKKNIPTEYKFCTQCSSTLDPMDKFCSSCGAKVRE
jgi:hypothetical protein